MCAPIQGDIITGINGKTIRNASDLYRILDHSKVGNSSLTAVRLVTRSIKLVQFSRFAAIPVVLPLYQHTVFSPLTNAWQNPPLSQFSQPSQPPQPPTCAQPSQPPHNLTTLATSATPTTSTPLPHPCSGWRHAGHGGAACQVDRAHPHHAGAQRCMR